MSSRRWSRRDAICLLASRTRQRDYTPINPINPLHTPVKPNTTHISTEQTQILPAVFVRILPLSTHTPFALVLEPFAASVAIDTESE